MVLFNHATREMTAKIVYYGPGLCGKTTNLMVIFDKLDPKSKGKMLSLATKTDRTLFFDLLPVDIGKVGPFNLKIQLYTVPGQVFYNETRKLVLKGVDAVVFVSDSQQAMVEATRESFANLLENLDENQIDPNDTPIVIQFNKRDLPGVLPVEQLQELLGFEGYPYTEASALKGDGVMETFRLVSKITAKHLFARLKLKSEPVRRTPAKVEVKATPEPEPLVDEVTPDESIADTPNPFADSIPFPDAGAADADYDRAEEVSLEQLLAEGRTRPETFHGTVAIPIIEEPMPEEVEELGAEHLVPEPEPLAPGASIDEPAPAPEVAASANDPRVPELEMQVASLRATLQSVLRELDTLRDRVREAIE